MFLIVDIFNFRLTTVLDHKSLMSIPIIVINEYTKQRFAFDFYPNLHYTQLANTSVLLLFHIVAHSFFASEIKIVEKCVELCL